MSWERLITIYFTWTSCKLCTHEVHVKCTSCTLHTYFMCTSCTVVTWHCCYDKASTIEIWEYLIFLIKCLRFSCLPFLLTHILSCNYNIMMSTWTAHDSWFTVFPMIIYQVSGWKIEWKPQFICQYNNQKTLNVKTLEVHCVGYRPSRLFNIVMILPLLW